MAEYGAGAGLAAAWMTHSLILALTRRGALSRSDARELIDGAILIAETTEASLPEVERRPVREARQQLELMLLALEANFLARPET